MTYLFWTLVHIVGVLGFQFTGIVTFLIPSAMHICLSMFVFVVGAAAALNPGFEPEDDEDEEEIQKDFGSRFLLQLGFVATGMTIYNIGYAFFAGMVILQAGIMALTIIFQKVSSIKE